MTNSIIEESKKARGIGKLLNGGRKKAIIIAVVLLFVSASAYAYWNSSDNSGETEVQKKEWTVKKGNIQIATESDGKVVAEDGVELSFSVTGDTLEVEDVYVKEGDEVNRGDKIALVKTEKLQFDLQSAYVSYRSALANLESKQAGPTEEAKAKANASIEQAKLSLEQSKISLSQTKLTVEQQISTAEKNVITAKKNLEAAENNLKLNIDNASSNIVNDAYSDLVNNIKSISVTLRSVLSDTDAILGVDETFINDDFESLLGAKNLSTLTAATASYSQAKSANSSLDTYILTIDTSTQAEIDIIAAQTETAISQEQTLLFNMQQMLDQTVTSGAYTHSNLDSHKATISSDRSKISSAATTLTNGLQAVSNAKNNLSGYQISYDKAKADYDKAKADLTSTKDQTAETIANSEAAVTAKELSLKQAQISYNELVAPAREVDLASYRAQLRSAAINIEKAKYNLEQSTLTTPIDGKVSILNYKVGDIIVKSDNKPMASIINNDTLFIEVRVEEADIDKIKIGQKANVTFDAVDDLQLTGEVSFISLTSETNNSGIVTYLVRIVIDNSSEENIREGMTAFVDFISAEVKDVLIVPVSAVSNVEGQPSVQLTSGEWVPVTTGFTDGKEVEVISGLKAGDKIFY